MESAIAVGSVPYQDPMEGGGNLTLARLAYLAAVVASAPMVWVFWKSYP